MTPNPTPPATSPTGQAVVSQILTRIALVVFTIAGAIALAPTAGVDVSFLPPIVPKVCALVAFVAATAGFAGPGLRKVAPMILLCVGVGLASCAHVDAIVVTKDTIHATRLAAQATEAGMRSADSQHLLTPDQVHRWNVFLAYFQKGFVAAADVWEAAADAHDEDGAHQAEAILTRFMADLAGFAVLLVTPSDGGAS